MTPDTILRWHRQLIAQKWTFAPKRLGRPGAMKEIVSLIVRMAAANPAWGYSRIQGALKNFDHHVARSTVATVLKDNRIPAGAASGQRDSEGSSKRRGAYHSDPRSRRRTPTPTQNASCGRFAKSVWTA